MAMDIHVLSMVYSWRDAHDMKNIFSVGMLMHIASASTHLSELLIQNLYFMVMNSSAESDKMTDTIDAVPQEK